MSALRRSCEETLLFTAHEEETSVPACPPPEVDAAVGAALARAAALASTSREMHFAIAEDGSLEVQLRDLDGTVLKDLRPGQASSLMGGLGLA